QRDQRRNHDAGAGQHGRGKLVGQRLAGARGHHRQRRFPRQHALDHPGLDTAKLLEAEHPAQGIPGFVDPFHRRCHGGGCGRSARRREPRLPRFCRFLGPAAPLVRLGAGAVRLPMDDRKEVYPMKKFALIAAAAGVFALAGCGSADDASEDAMADTVEMPADEAMAAAPDPVADTASEAVTQATDDAENAVDATAQEAGDAAVDAAAEAEAAAQAAATAQ